MKIKVNKSVYNENTLGYLKETDYDLEVDDEKLVKAITTKTPVCYYALIDGKVFKSDQYKGLGNIFFSSEMDLVNALKHGLYWRKRIIPDIGCGVGYDTDDFYKKLKSTHNIEIKQVIL